MMSGSGILTNGKGTRREYSDFNLDELQVNDNFIKNFVLLPKVVSNFTLASMIQVETCSTLRIPFYREKEKK